MYPDFGLVILPLAVIFLWLGWLTFLVTENRRFLKGLFPRSGERDIRKKLEEVIAFINSSNSKFERVTEEIKKLDRSDSELISRMEMMRYNPFEDTGGIMSFSLALLDRKGSGVIITSLHSRAGTRVFAKPVILGKATDYSFSKEEEQVIKKAMEK